VELERQQEGYINSTRHDTMCCLMWMCVFSAYGREGIILKAIKEANNIQQNKKNEGKKFIAW
jgi:hypothetical protein